MLQPAQNHSDHSREPLGPPRYDELLDRAETALRDALLLGTTGFPDGAAAHAEFVGFERYLSVAGRHLALLADTVQDSKHMRELSRRLTTHRDSGSGGGLWHEASVLLATAHDVLASHLHSPGIPATPEASGLIAERSGGNAVHRLLGLLLESADASWDLYRRAVEARNPGDLRLQSDRMNGMRHTSRAIELYAKAAIYDLGSSSSDAGLSSLTPARPTALTRSTDFESAIEALQALRQLSYRQGNGNLDVSAASLRDLTRLATRITDPAARWLPEPMTPLERVHSAATRDRFETAHQSWTAAGQDLTHSVRSLTRAPSPYAQAIAVLLKSATSSPSLNAAVLATLPRLADDAVPAIKRLTAKGALVRGERRPGELSVTWQAITAAEGQELGERFSLAAVASANASATAAALSQPAGRAPAPAQTRRELTREGQVTR